MRKVGDGQGADRWVADGPDESAAPLPDVTVTWLLWHVERWWEQTLRSREDLPWSLWGVVAWVNVELTKNLAEKHQPLVRRDNRVASVSEPLGDQAVSR